MCIGNLCRTLYTNNKGKLFIMKFLVDSVTEDLKRSIARECGKLVVGTVLGVMGKIAIQRLL